MNIEGTYTLQAPGEEVWHYLMDQEILRTTIPGVESVEQIDKNTYDITVTMQYASLKGSYHGHLIHSEQQYPYHYRLHIEGEGSQGTFSGSGSVHLNTHENTTIIAYKGTLTTGKLSSHLPQSLVKGAVKLFIQQYFLALAERLQNKQQAQSQADPETDAGEIIRRGNTLTLPAEATQKNTDARSTIYTRIVHLLHLGAGDPDEEIRWAQRLRRVSIASGLLFLVWIGTRLPRRR